LSYFQEKALSIFPELHILVALATTRSEPEAEYNFNFGGGYQAFGFEIDSYKPSTSGSDF
jgi:hypothetical protein